MKAIDDDDDDDVIVAGADAVAELLVVSADGGGGERPPTTSPKYLMLTLHTLIGVVQSTKFSILLIFVFTFEYLILAECSYRAHVQQWYQRLLKIK